jgi:tripartite-type tricarboxylate transporter receptor subunit TctC
VAESGVPGFDTATWSGLYVPGATPREVIRRIHADIHKIMTAPDFKKRMLQQGIDQSEADTPEKHAAFLKSELTRWSKVIAEARIRAE